jgi:hypothetical protein
LPVRVAIDTPCLCHTRLFSSQVLQRDDGEIARSRKMQRDRGTEIDRSEVDAACSPTNERRVWWSGLAERALGILATAYGKQSGGYKDQSDHTDGQENQRRGLGDPGHVPDAALQLEIGVIEIAVSAPEEILESQRRKVARGALGIVDDGVGHTVGIARARPHQEGIAGIQHEDFESTASGLTL